MTWHVIMTKPQRESYAAEKLIEQGFTVYCPLRLHEIMGQNQVVIKDLPLFPRYLFVYQNKLFLQKQHALRSTPGVNQLIRYGDMPTPVDDAVIASVRAAEQSFRDQAVSYFQPGESVHIREGIYRNVEAIYMQDDGEQRAILLIQLLQKEVKASLAKHILQKK